MEKRKAKVFGKDHFLLGADKEGTLYWLQAPSWDCGWYWGFGYIETFTNNQNPERSRDIESHQHADKFLSKFFMNILKQRTFTDHEGWELSELFEQYYFLRDCAENFGRGKCHCANTQAPTWKKPELVKEVNENLLPDVMKRIIEILTPKG